jgi:putative transposase
MARLARIIAVDTPHHVTQRGNARQPIFQTDTDRLVYLDLLRRDCRLHELSLVGYCLMSNHVHLITIPTRPDSLQLVLKQTHGRYAAYFNARYATSGRLWQGRYYSCPLGASHFWNALRYTELNPVRAGIVAAPDRYPWSSAGAHCSRDGADSTIDPRAWQSAWTPAEWREFLEAGEAPAESSAIRQSTHSGRPLGSAAFVAKLEKMLGRRLTPQKGGRPRKRDVEAPR